MEKTVSGLIAAWRLAASPTINLFSFLSKDTTEGVVRDPSGFSKTRGVFPSITEMHELVVPRSIPTILLLILLLILLIIFLLIFTYLYLGRAENLTMKQISFFNYLNNSSFR